MQLNNLKGIFTWTWILFAAIQNIISENGKNYFYFTYLCNKWENVQWYNTYLNPRNVQKSPTERKFYCLRSSHWFETLVELVACNNATRFVFANEANTDFFSVEFKYFYHHSMSFHQYFFPSIDIIWLQQKRWVFIMGIFANLVYAI